MKRGVALLEDDKLEILGVASRLGLRFGSGYCGEIAIAIRRVLFGGRGKLIAVVNAEMWFRGYFVGHVGVREKDGTVWDMSGLYREGAIEEDFSSWGMLDPEDPDYQPLTDEEAEEVLLLEMTPKQVRKALPNCQKLDPYKILMEAKRIVIEEKLKRINQSLTK